MRGIALWHGWMFALLPVVAACTTPATQAVAPTTLDQQAKSFIARPDAGTLYLYQGIKRQMRTLWQKSEVPLAAPADYFVNGQMVGGLNQGQFFALTLPAGEYRITWKERWDGATVSQPYSLSVAAGNTYFLRSVFGSAGSEMLGILGGLTFRYYLEPPPGTGPQDVAGRTLVQSNAFMFGGIGAMPSASPRANVVRPIAAPPQRSGPISERLSKLKALYEGKLISEQEYANKRKQILDGL
jgi:hypothetical protein